jgi:outer membrane protein assembly factor BamA
MKECAMRLIAAILTLFAFASQGRAQSPLKTTPDGVQVRNLILVSDDLPQADRERVMRCLRGQTYLREEYEERIRQSLRNLGYYNAQVEEATLAEVHEEQTGKSAIVFIKVVSGAQYRLGYMQFKHATLFPSDQLRSQFPIQTGSLYCASSLAYGLEKLRGLYQEKGYINFGAVPLPAIDDARHVVNLSIDLDEGKPYVFGHLVIDGVETRAGAAKDLVESWMSLQGKTYNPELLKTWLRSN